MSIQDILVVLRGFTVVIGSRTAVTLLIPFALLIGKRPWCLQYGPELYPIQNDEDTFLPLHKHDVSDDVENVIGELKVQLLI